MPVKLLISKVREVNRAAVHDIVAAPILMNPRPGVEIRRIEVECFARGGSPDNHLASTLRGAHFYPADVIAGNPRLTKSNRPLHNQV